MNFKLNAQSRTVTTHGDLQKARKSKKLPANIYGHGMANHTVSLDYGEFERIISTAGTSSLIDVALEGAKEPMKVIIAEVQQDPVSDRYIHVDLHEVRMDEKIRTDLTLNFIGESPAVKALGANLIISKDRIEIECLPKDLISSFDVDISVLENFDDSLHISDLKIPAGITILDNASESVVSALAPKEEKEEVAPVAPIVEGEVPAAAEGAAEGTETAAATPEKK